MQRLFRATVSLPIGKNLDCYKMCVKGESMELAMLGLIPEGEQVYYNYNRDEEGVYLETTYKGYHIKVYKEGRAIRANLEEYISNGGTILKAISS